MSSTITSAPSTASSSAPTSSCTTAVPGKYGYVPPDACNANYSFDPNFGGAIAMSVLFSMALIAHIAQGVAYKKRFTWVIIMSVSWEAASFILRAVGAHNQNVQGYVVGFTLLLLLAPLCKLLLLNRPS
jgi:hypothetical protein